MPIVYVHGVATRDTSPGYEESWEAIETLLREYIAPVISDRPDQEFDLFVSHPPRDRPAPTPSDEHLGYWWNVWDYNDFLSYRAAGMVEGVDDKSYSSGLSVVSAHSGYSRRPSFYRRFADKLHTADRLRYGRRT
jgi:hypothetical protein